VSNTAAPATVGLPIAGIPREVVALWGRYDFRSGPIKGVAVGAGYNWTDKRRNGNFQNRYEASYETYSVALYYSLKIRGQKWTAQLNTNNLGDATYVSGNNFGPRRDVRFSLRTAF
jgi:outer membrane receptor for ferric coprogen and ferric-rhodotorulic acid